VCLTLYLASLDEQQLRQSAEISVEAVQPAAELVRQWFSLPFVRFIGAYTGCSCGFRFVNADEPVEYYEGMFNESGSEQRESMESLVVLIREHVALGGEVEMYPLWNDKVDVRPKGTIELRASALDPRSFFFVEQFFYRVYGEKRA